jgi:L-ascorbate metabolism protein UlaG (beta-lactamase superfamily)
MAGTLTWLGHSCATIRLDGILAITDPALRGRIFHLRRLGPIDTETLGAVNVILISHIHYDHLDLPSLDRFDRTAQVIVPAGAGGLLRRRGFRFVREVAAGDEVDLGEVAVRVTYAEHASSRRMGTARTPAVGYVIAGSRSVYFAGDTDVFEGMDSFGRIDVALLPVAGWGPRLPAGHLDPARAVRALELIKPGIAVPIHWGTYAPWGRPSGFATPAGTFADLAASVTPAVDVRILRPGESCPLD